MHFPRSSGVLLHLTSLPNEFAIGDLGEGAYQFVDFLQKSGQAVWQVLPLGPTGYGDSPYSSYSAFAGNPLLIGLHDLVERGLLSAEAVDQAKVAAGSHVEFEQAKSTKLPLLEKAFEAFQGASEYEEFCELNHWWLDDFARFSAISEHFGHSDWSQWGPELVSRDAGTLAGWDERLSDRIRFVKFVQFTFFRQWHELKTYANDRGIKILGDMPIFVAYQSADVWANQDLFCLDNNGRQTVVAGVPPDYFSETGQRWGNPLYDWDRNGETGYDWWIRRFRVAFECFDIMRIDHFRGFESYWEVKAECPTAIDGQWQPGPGAALFQAAERELGELPIVAEDLGLITDEVHALRDELGFPGMRVFQFGFDDENDPYHRPEAYPQHSACYTGTHDNDTIMGWFQQRKQHRDDDALLDVVVTEQDPQPHVEMIRAVFHSPSDTAIIPLQDLIGLDSQSRMNTPGEPTGNWTWRCTSEQLQQQYSDQLRSITEDSGRLAGVPVSV